MDFTSQACRAIKISNLLRVDRKAINKSRGGTHMFSFQVYQKSFPLEWNLDYVPPAYEGVQCSAVRALKTTPWQWAYSISVTHTHQGKKLEQIMLRNIATPLEARPTIREALLVSWGMQTQVARTRGCHALRSVRKPDHKKTKWRVKSGNGFTAAACSSTPYSSSVRAVLRKQSSASLCFRPLVKDTQQHESNSARHPNAATI